MLYVHILYSKISHILDKTQYLVGEEALEKLGLTRREANKFIVYWLPQMEQNTYNIITFQTDTYTDASRLEVNPTPDTLIRVIMAWKKRLVVMRKIKLVTKPSLVMGGVTT